MNPFPTPEERRRLAEMVGVNPATLYQALTAKGAGFAPAECVRIERDSGFALRRWNLRPNDWHLIWPELIGSEGAPVVKGAPRAPHPLRRSTDRIAGQVG